MTQPVTYKFDPDWVVHPGDTLREWIETNGLGLRSAASALGLDPEYLADVVNGVVPVVRPLAERLAHLSGPPVSFWLNMQANFDAGIKAGKTWTHTYDEPLSL